MRSFLSTPGTPKKRASKTPPKGTTRGLNRQAQLSERWLADWLAGEDRCLRMLVPPCRPTEKPALSVWQKGCELVITPFPARSGAQVPSNLSRVKLGSLVPPPHAQKFEGAIWVSAHNKAPHLQRAHRRGRRPRLPPSSLPMATLQIFPIGGEFLPIQGVSSSSRQGDYLGY